MAPAIRPMEPRDTADVSRLIRRRFPHTEDHPRHDTEALLDWLYFSPHLTNEMPRAFVVEEGDSIIGHVGLTVSEWRGRSECLKVVHPINWVADTRCGGLSSFSLMLRAVSSAGVAANIGGTETAQRILPTLGFSSRLCVESYVKVINPWRFLRLSRSGIQVAKGAVKVGCSVAGEARSGIGQLVGRVRQFRLTEVDGPTAWEADAESHRTRLSHSGAVVLRNTLAPRMLQWYQQCPKGKVHVLGCLEGDRFVGEAVVFMRTIADRRYATILSVDTWVDDQATWIGVLGEIEAFVRGQGATHINVLATYQPLLRALKYHGYFKLKPLPLWLRDGCHALEKVTEWHITAIEGDIGYLID